MLLIDPKQWVLSLCLLLTANYDALQVCPDILTCYQKWISASSSSSIRQPLLYKSSTFRSFSQTHTHKPTHMENVIRSASCCGFRVTQSLSWSRRNKRVEESGGMDEDTGFLDRFWVEISEQLVSYKQYIMSFISPTLLAHGFLIKNNLSWFSVEMSNPSHCLSHHIQHNLSIVISLTLNTYREEGLFVFTELITCLII